MNIKKIYLPFVGSLAVICVLLGCPGNHLFAASTPANNSTATAETGGADVAKATEHLRIVQTGFNAGINTGDDVCHATIALANAEIASASGSDRGAVVEKALATIVAQRQELLRRATAQYENGALGSDEVIQVKIALAQARARMELYNVVALRKQYLDLLRRRSQTGSVPPEDLEKAQGAYQAALTMFTQTAENP